MIVRAPALTIPPLNIMACTAPEHPSEPANRKTTLSPSATNEPEKVMVLSYDAKIMWGVIATSGGEGEGDGGKRGGGRAGGGGEGGEGGGGVGGGGIGGGVAGDGGGGEGVGGMGKSASWTCTRTPATWLKCESCEGLVSPVWHILYTPVSAIVMLTWPLAMMPPAVS